MGPYDRYKWSTVYITPLYKWPYKNGFHFGYHPYKWSYGPTLYVFPPSDPQNSFPLVAFKRWAKTPSEGHGSSECGNNGGRHWPWPAPCDITKPRPFFVLKTLPVGTFFLKHSISQLPWLITSMFMNPNWLSAQFTRTPLALGFFLGWVCQSPSSCQKCLKRTNLQGQANLQDLHQHLPWEFTQAKYQPSIFNDRKARYIKLKMGKMIQEFNINLKILYDFPSFFLQSRRIESSSNLVASRRVPWRHYLPWLCLLRFDESFCQCHRTTQRSPMPPTLQRTISSLWSTSLCRTYLQKTNNIVRHYCQQNTKKNFLLAWHQR